MSPLRINRSHLEELPQLSFEIVISRHSPRSLCHRRRRLRLRLRLALSPPTRHRPFRGIVGRHIVTAAFMILRIILIVGLVFFGSPDSIDENMQINKLVK
ncbi:unnamed protein product, partial [Nesidiocoris tenuis]